MSQVLKYKGYIGSLECDLEENMLHGQVEYTSDLIFYDGETPEELKANFEAAVDQYIATCEKHGKQPLKSMSGTFNCRIGPDLHQQLAMMAFERGTNINSLLIEALKSYISGEKKSCDAETFEFVTIIGGRNEFHQSRRNVRSVKNLSLSSPHNLVDVTRLRTESTYMECFDA